MAELKTGDRLGFCDPGAEPDIWAEVLSLSDDEGTVLLFGELAILDYAPGVIQQGISDGAIVVKP